MKTKYLPDPQIDAYIDDTLGSVQAMYEIPKTRFLSKARTRDAVRPRQLVLIYLYRRLGLSLGQLGWLFGLDRGTVLHVRDQEKKFVEDMQILDAKMKIHCGWDAPPVPTKEVNNAK